MRRSFQEVLATPTASLMTITVLAVALALPVAFHTTLKNTEQLAANMDKASRITLFLKLGSSAVEVQKLATNLSLRQDIVEIETITPEQGLKDFEERSGFGDSLEYLDKNPLPYVLIVTPSSRYESAENAETLLQEFGKLRLVDKAQLDLEWIKRLQAIMELSRRGIEALNLLFALAVILVVGNTIRLSIHSRKDEIKVVKLVGATNGFIRRPFLYSGIWFGLGGAIMAWLMLIFALKFLQQPVADLARAYGSNFELAGLSWSEGAVVLGIGATLGWLGSWISVSRHIALIEPGN
jgi:cell division transport system permease protein